MTTNRLIGRIALNYKDTPAGAITDHSICVLRATRSGDQFLGDDDQIAYIDHAITVDIRAWVEARLAGALPEGGFHDCDVGTVDFAVAVDVAEHLRGHLRVGLGHGM